MLCNSGDCPRSPRAGVVFFRRLRSTRIPEDFVIDTLIRPYVNAEAYLLFEQGVQHEGHAQNVLVEVDANERLTRRLIARFRRIE